MKNPLVDALRQANAGAELSHSSEDQQSGKDDAPAVDATAAELVLDLAASAALPEPAPIGDEDNINDESRIDRLSVEPESISEDMVDDETRLLPVLIERSLPELPGCEPSSGIVAARTAVGETQWERHWLERLGFWSPAVALLALSTTAGAYALFQHLTVKNLNYDLSELSLRMEDDARTPLANREWSELPETNVLVDTGGYIQSQAISTPVRGEESSVAKAEQERTETFERASVTTAGAERLSIQDPAFAHVQSGFDAYQSGDYERAAEHYRDAIAIDANHRYALAGLAAALQKTSDPGEWLPLYEKLLALNPKDAVAASVLLMHEMSGDPQRKMTRLKILLQRYPEVAELHLAMGLLAGERGQWAEARLAFLSAYRIAPGNSNYSFNAAVSMEHLGQYDQARFYYQLASAAQNALIDQEMIARQLRKLSAGPGASL